MACVMDWAKDPCAGCGRYPLAVTNKTGYCRVCSRGSHRNHLRPRGRRKKERT